MLAHTKADEAAKIIEAVLQPNLPEMVNVYRIRLVNGESDLIEDVEVAAPDSRKALWTLSESMAGDDGGMQVFSYDRIQKNVSQDEVPEKALRWEIGQGEIRNTN